MSPECVVMVLLFTLSFDFAFISQQHRDLGWASFAMHQQILFKMGKAVAS
uniref:Uncharacterized protein n=1 Tax=Anguilla anguilla TaxID=7936 RepID=A0A0E9P9F4_ANGAN